ncbi:MAG: hypothetical protein LUH14_06140 [Clostridiaceae bacterium]|nr:hypothetical protein [Clostridiaceae bacterium]
MKSRGVSRQRAETLVSLVSVETEQGVDVLPYCPENRGCCAGCHGYREGRCAVLEDVSFEDNICPFYKGLEHARKERIAAMEKLEDSGRIDLINRYYRNRTRFEKILADEMIGISYAFDDDMYGGRNRRNV